MEQQLIWFMRITLAGLMGAMVGYERHSQSKEAGVKTHCIVALSSAMIMILSKYGFADSISFDASRIASQVVTGIGFLGAGIIFVKNDTIQGLTTAAGVWATCGIGMCIGAGMYALGIMAAVIIVAVQLFMRRSRFFGTGHLSMTMDITLDDTYTAEMLHGRFRKLKIVGSDFRAIDQRMSDHCWKVEVNISIGEEYSIQRLMRDLMETSGIRQISVVNKSI